ncbi:MAG: mannitol-1-phosphate 5-dehydrogenase [Bacteroidetes bacterium]|nr:MAG: mannitol-1-phosphate 5-dehydrogenase [Bacteroidota bacterium]
MEEKLVLFGAGKIGRSFIGQLFSRGGYEVVFVDVFKPVIDEINRRREYNVVIKGNHESVIQVKNVRGVYAGNENAVIDEVANAAIVATAVGQIGLPGIFPLLAKGIEKRKEKYSGLPLDIIIAENLMNAAEYFNTELWKYLPAGFPLHQIAGLVETSIGKMVPLMSQKDLQTDMLQVFAEEYNTLVLDKKAFKNPIPQIEGLAPKENIKAWIDTKFFIHTLGHATAAYLGFTFNPGMIYLHEVLDVPELYSEIRETMLQSATALIKRYPEEFTFKMLHEHIDDLLLRFRNRALGDTIYRVGCDLKRKLSPNDRVAGAIKLAREMDLPYDKMLKALVCGCRFRATGENGKMFQGDIEFAAIYETGIRNVLTRICGFDEKNDKQLIWEVEKMDKEIAGLLINRKQ